MHKTQSQELHGVKHFLAAFGYSISGLRMASKETAIRHELIMAGVHFSTIVILGIPLVRGFVLTLMLGGVFVTELLNTAIEATVDLASPGKNELAKKAKDLGSAAVFCALILFFVGWGFTVLEVVK